MSEDRPPLPPFTLETAIQKVRAGRGRLEHPRSRAGRARLHASTATGETAPNSSTGRDEIVAFLTRKWNRELDYRLIKELWAFAGNRIAVRFAYEWHDDSGNWFRSYGNENWEFDAQRPDAPPLRLASTTCRSANPTGCSNGIAAARGHSTIQASAISVSEGGHLWLRSPK